MLFDKTTKRVTALLDFDFAGITHPVHEFFTGLWDIGGATHNDIEQIRFATITGIFEEADERLSAEDKDKWEIAKAWNSALAAQGTIRPSTIQGIEKLDKLRQLEEVLCPHHLGSSVMVERMRRKTPEKEQEIVQAAADKVVAFLEDLGA